MNLVLYLIIFILGISIGSFLNCVIYRLKSNQSFLKGWSFCPNCRHRLGFFDLIPILSFLFLKGKCRYCGKKISWQYPLVEITTGIIFVLIFNFPNFITIIYLLIISCFLIIIFVYDLRYYIIPDEIIYPAIGAVFIYKLIFNLQTPNLYFSLLTALAASGFFFLLWFLSRGRWMGFGDVKLAFFMGFFLGFPNILVSLFSAVFIGAIIGLVLVTLGKKTLKSKVPFGPFLVTGTFIALFWGQDLINWYISLLT